MNITENVNQNATEQLPIGVIGHDLSYMTPSASEIGELWDSYLAENMAVCMLKYMVAKSKDPDIKSVLQQSLNASNQKMQKMIGLFNTVNYPIPEGFGDDDVDINAPELFSETFSLAYTQVMNIYVVIKHTWALGRSTRSDFRQLFLESINMSNDIYQKATDVLLAKGIITKSPSINPPERIDKVTDKNYYGSLISGKRPLNAIEISHLTSCARDKNLLSILNLGFSQVIKDKKIKDFTFKGVQMFQEQRNNLTKYLEEDYIPMPLPSSFQVSSSVQSPYSDRLMLFHSTTVAAFTLLEIGFMLSNSARKDLITAFHRTMMEILEYSKEGTDLLIENGWLERVPEATNREKLIH